jgi:hypothetical protein
VVEEGAVEMDSQHLLPLGKFELVERRTIRMPALLTRMSRRPKVLTVLAMPASTCSSEVI